MVTGIGGGGCVSVADGGCHEMNRGGSEEAYVADLEKSVVPVKGGHPDLEADDGVGDGRDGSGDAAEGWKPLERGAGGPEAAREFQKIIDHRGIVVSDPIGALAHLQLGRAFVLLGEKTKAKTAYGDFLTLWKDADSNIPIFKQVKAEYAKLG
jgi:hypothetical protein